MVDESDYENYEDYLEALNADMQSRGVVKSVQKHFEEVKDWSYDDIIETLDELRDADYLHFSAGSDEHNPQKFDQVNKRKALERALENTTEYQDREDFKKFSDDYLNEIYR